MRYRRMPIEIESPEQLGYNAIACNLAESSVTDVRFADLNLDLSKLVLMYSDHYGKPELRALLTQESNVLWPEHVLMTVGAAAALFIIATSLLQPGDHVVVVYPNYATNIETPRQIGADIELHTLSFEDGWALDVDALAARIRPGTKYVSITLPHNPTGMMLPESDLRRLVHMIEQKNTLLLVDETYREMGYASVLPLAASLSDRVIGVSSLSKTYGLPGIRMGWLMTQNPALMELFLAAKEQIFISGSVLDEEVAYQYLREKPAHLARIKADIARKFALVRDWMAEEPLMQWAEPQGGVVCFPRIRPDLNINLDAFYEQLNGHYKTQTGPGHWFEADRHHMRVGFGWPGDEEMKAGLSNISSALRDVLGA